MSETTVRLVPKDDQQIDAGVVGKLREMTERAESGDLDGVAIVALTRSGGNVTSYSPIKDRLKLIGALDYLRYRPLKGYDEE